MLPCFVAPWRLNRLFKAFHMSSEELQHRRKNNYKLLVDPELVKGKKKLYRLNGAIPGKAPIPDPKDPRVLKTVLGVDGTNVGLRLPRFKYDKFWTGSPPLREVLISGLNELSTKGSIIKDLCETVSPTFFVKFHRHLKSRIFLGSATVSFVKAGSGERAVDELNGAVVCGCKITVELDDRGDLAKEVYASKDNRRFSVDSLKSDATTPTIKGDESAFFNNHENNRDDAFQSPSSFPFHPLSQKFNLISTVKTKSLSSSVEGSPRTSGCGLTTPNSGISIKHAFDPILALKTCLLAKKNKITSIPPLPPKENAPPLPSEAPPPPPETPPPQIGLEEISSEDEATKKGQNSSSVFFEDISGEDGSPLVTKSQIMVEDITSCEEDGERGNGSVDMDISDTEQNSTQIIEINVHPVTAPTSNFIPPPLPPPTFPSQTFLNYQLTSEGPKTPPSEVRGDRLDNSAHSKTRKNKFSPAKQWKVPLAVSREEKRGQDVLYCALEQLSRILLRDVEKKLVESSAFPVLDQVWDKKESQRSKATGEDPTETEERVKPQEPYRRMLPSLVPNRPRPQDDDESPTPITPRKRLMNFKIPLVGSMFRRDNVMTATRRLHFNDRGERDKRKRKNHYSEVLPRRKRRHRKDDKDERRGDYSQLSDISSEEWPSDEGTKIRDKDKNKYRKNGRKDNAFGPRTPSATSDEEDDEFNKIFQEEEEEEEKADSDSSLFNEIFGSSSSSDFEADIASLRRPKKTVKPSKPAITKPSNLIESELIATPPVAEDEVEEEEIERIVEYDKRGEGEEAAILNSFLEDGFDKEDVDMMRSAYVKLKEIYSELISDISWSYYPHTVVENNVTHSSGCARSEGYYKIDPSDKSRYLHHLRRSKASDDKDKNSAPPPTSSGRGNRLNHRRVASLFTSGDVSRELQQYNQLKARKKQLTFAKSTIHNWGLFALETIPADEMVVEYIGQVVRHGIADERERRYEAQGIGSSYLFRVDYDHVIDATKSGNFARFINHCCDPNCYAKIITVGNHKKIVIYSKRDIRAGEEITYDYKFPIEDEKIPCLCGAPQCRGTLN